MLETSKLAAVSAFCLSALLGGTVTAQEALPKTTINIVGHNSPQIASHDEIAHWKKVAADTNGSIIAKITPNDHAGIADGDLLRLLDLGVMDGVGFDLSKVSGDDPLFQGCDIPGLAEVSKDAYLACDSFREIIDARLQRDWNAKLYAIGANQPQVFWCRDSVKTLADLKGKKIRVFNEGLRSFVKEIGGNPISMSFAEVVPALNNGVVDCAVTGSLTGNVSGWPEVSKSVFMVPLGWSINVELFNLDWWNGLDEKVRQYLEDTRPDYEKALWDSVERATQESRSCNQGQDPCVLGKKVHMEVNEMTDADKAIRDKVVNDVVLAGWAKECDADCIKQWNQTAGQALNVHIERE